MLRELFARVLVARVVFIEGVRAFKHKKCILERKVFAAIATNVGQKESVSCPAVVVEGMELTLNVIQQASLCVQTRLVVLIFTSAVRPTFFQTVQRAQRRNRQHYRTQQHFLLSCHSKIG